MRVARAFVGMALATLLGCKIDLGGGSSEPFDPAHAVDLGTAVYPASAAPNNPAVHKWSAKLNPTSYSAGYALDPTERGSVRDSFLAYSRSVSYTKEGDGFRWRPPPQCVGDMHCAYNNIASRSGADLEPLVERFRARQRAANLNTADLAALIVTFVQNIRYEIPKEMPFGILPPALVVAEQRGDCDSKSLLGHMLLRSFGIDSVLVSSQAHRHAMLAIALPSSGTKFTHQGRQYAFTEMTAKGSPIGHINRSLTSPNDWRVVTVSYGSAAPPATPPKPSAPPRPAKKPR